VKSSAAPLSPDVLLGGGTSDRSSMASESVLLLPFDAINRRSTNQSTQRRNPSTEHAMQDESVWPYTSYLWTCINVRRQEYVKQVNYVCMCSCVHGSATHTYTRMSSREILRQADEATPPLDLTKAKSIFNIQSIIFYDILCIWMSTLPFRSICSLISVYLILNLI
jgi:hypothetical protein